MSALIYGLTTAALMVLMIRAGAALVDPQRWRAHRRTVVAATLTGLVLAGLVLQTAWAGAMDALDSDPARPGWWRLLTSPFLQSPDLAGRVWNVVTVAIVAALAEWCWGRWPAAGSFVAGMLLPTGLAVLAGAGRSTDPRNFCGSSGATYFLGATLAAALLLAGRDLPARLLALAVPVLGLATWIAQHNGHGLVAVEGFGFGLVVALVTRGPAVVRAAHRG